MAQYFFQSLIQYCAGNICSTGCLRPTCVCCQRFLAQQETFFASPFLYVTLVAEKHNLSRIIPVRISRVEGKTFNTAWLLRKKMVSRPSAQLKLTTVNKHFLMISICEEIELRWMLSFNNISVCNVGRSFVCQFVFECKQANKANKVSEWTTMCSNATLLLCGILSLN